MKENRILDEEIESLISEAIVDRSRKEDFVRKMQTKRKKNIGTFMVPIISISVAACIVLIITINTNSPSWEGTDDKSIAIVKTVKTPDSKQIEESKRITSVNIDEKTELIAKNNNEVTNNGEKFVLDNQRVFSVKVDTEYEEQWKTILELKEKGLHKEAISMLLIFVKQSGRHKEEADSLLLLLEN